MAMNLLEFSDNYCMASGYLCNYYIAKVDNVDVNDSPSDSESFKCKTKIVGEKPEMPPQPGDLGDTERSPSGRIYHSTQISQ